MGSWGLEIIAFCFLCFTQQCSVFVTGFGLSLAIRLSFYFEGHSSPFAVCDCSDQNGVTVHPCTLSSRCSCGSCWRACMTESVQMWLVSNRSSKASIQKPFHYLSQDLIWKILDVNLMVTFPVGKRLSYDDPTPTCRRCEPINGYLWVFKAGLRSIHSSVLNVCRPYSAPQRVPQLMV